MPGRAASNRSGVGARLRALLPLLVLGAILVAAPLPGPSGATARDGAAGRAGLDRAHSFALLDSVATTPHGPERRDAPTGTLPALAAATLVALAGAIVVRARRVPTSITRTGFRRRAPPLLRIAS